jgi:hypothetical protein
VSVFLDAIRDEAERRTEDGERSCGARYSPAERRSLIAYHEIQIAQALLKLVAVRARPTEQETP